ncbi:hypothetical protein HR060_11185 [Catenovulum sp. SM1970]|uniref:hypothetical protein n=1 Tax=Marinifaba aquimaris TaxID=2741323 RepID=UPI001572600C|nr:hypothetical protein [Marinifaba aquimaris]NTS77424.1 hypothetical protein [Marinifaba aquimaris]
MANVAHSAPVLKKRLQRFFQSHNTGRQQVQLVVDQLEALGPTYLFGGAIRDIALEGMRNFYSDLDFVVDCRINKLDKLLDKLSLVYKTERNKFGGYRLYCAKWWLDIWAIENTWAFRQQKVVYQNHLSLLDSTIMNWDAALYQPSSNKLHTPKHYFDHLTQGHLQAVLLTNPNPKGALVRILRTLAGKQVKQLDAKLAEFIVQELNHTSLECLLAYEIDHYQTALLKQLDKVQLQQACSNPEQKTVLAWQQKRTTFNLPW